MKVIFLIIIFSIGTVFLFFKKENNIEDFQEVEFIKKVKVEDLIKKTFSKLIKLRGFSNASRIVILRSQVEGRISSKQLDSFRQEVKRADANRTTAASEPGWNHVYFSYS